MKKRVKRIFIFSMLVSVLLYSCSIKEKEVTLDSEELLSFDVSTLDDEIYEVKLTDLMESIEIIEMDSAKEAFTKIFRVTVSDSYFAIHHIKYPVKLYSRKTGKFLCNIGRRGNGPGEYFQIWNTVIEEDYNRIYLVNQFKNYIYSYDLNGDFHENENIYLSYDQGFERPYVFINKSENKAVIFQTPYEAYQNKHTNLKAINSFCIVQDLSGKPIQRIPSDLYQVPRNDTGVWASHIDQESPIYQCTITPFYDCRKDTIYHYNVETNELYPVYTSNMYTDKYTLVTSKETSMHYYTYQQTYKKGTSINPENRTGYKIFQVDKKTGKGKYIHVVNDYLGDIEFDVDYWFHDIKDDYVVYYWEPLVLKEHLEEALATNNEMNIDVRERVIRLKNSLDDNGNWIIMICKFKKH